jgi:hypothetical protein
VRTPIVHWEFTSQRVLTLEYLPGIKITDSQRLSAAGVATDLVARRATEAYLMQVSAESALSVMCVLGQGRATERGARHVAKKQDHMCIRGRAKNGCTWLCERGGVNTVSGGWSVDK